MPVQIDVRSTKLKNIHFYKGVFIRKTKHFCLLQPYFVWKLLSHRSWKTNPKVCGTLKVYHKSSQREYIRKNAYITPKPQGVLLPALHLKFSKSLTNFQASPARQSSLRSKDIRPNHTVFQIAARIERWQTVHFQLSVAEGLRSLTINRIPTREGHIVPPTPPPTPGILPQISQERLQLRTWNYLTI